MMATNATLAAIARVRQESFAAGATRARFDQMLQVLQSRRVGPGTRNVIERAGMRFARPIPALKGLAVFKRLALERLAHQPVARLAANRIGIAGFGHRAFPLLRAASMSAMASVMCFLIADSE